MNIKKLRREAKRYGMNEPAGLDARELDRRIQAKVAQDVQRGVCSACGAAIHWGDC